MIQMKRQYYIVSLILMLLSNRLLFDGARLFNAGLRHWDLSLPADAGIPFLPRMTLIYVGCYVWWLYVYWLITQRDRKDADRLFGANLLAKAVCFLILVIFPTSVTRPELRGDSIWIRLLQLLYAFDKPDNTFPSIHCLVGWFCWIGIRGKKDIPLLCRTASLLMALAVCFSTLAVRQHVLLDVPGGILLSELCYWIAGSEKFLCSYSAFIDKLMIGTKRIKE